jgi:HTH-type transcriptional regulator, competence development regulator
MENKNKLGELLQELRQKEKKALRDVAEETGLSHTYIRDLELGIRRATGKPIKPSAHVLRKLAEAYNYSFTELMKIAGYEDILRDYTDEGQKKHDLYKILSSDSEIPMWKGRLLSKAQRREVVNFVEFILNK